MQPMNLYADSSQPCKVAWSRIVYAIARLGVGLASLTLALCLTASPSLSQQRDVIKLAAFNYPPFYIEENGEVYGIAVDILNELFRRLDAKTEIQMYPLTRALNYLKSGEKDGIMILIKTHERQQYLKYTDPVMSVRGLLWVSAAKAKDVKFNSLDELKKYRIGVTRGYSYGAEFDALLRKFRVDVANADYNNYLKLLEGRIDVFPGNEIVAKGLFKAHPELKGKFVHFDDASIRWVLHMGISKESELVSRMPEINKVLADLKEEGIIEQAVKKYTE